MLEDLGLRVPNVDIVWMIRAALAHFALGFWAVLIVTKLFATRFRADWFRADFLSLLRLAFWGGVVNNLVDLDHLSMVVAGHPHGRIWHTPALWVALAAISFFLLFMTFSRQSNCARVSCPTCEGGEAAIVWRRRLGFAALMGVSVIVHVLEDYYIGAF